MTTKEKAPALSPRDAYLRRQFGVTEEQWGTVLAYQGGGCAVCGRKGVTKSLPTDHDHASGLFRGILCNRHNIALREGQTPEALRKMADYLDNPPAVAALGVPLYGRVGRVHNKRKRRKRRTTRKKR